MPVAALATALLGVAGCVTSKPHSPTTHVTELSDVPFFAQQRYQCGPAALATILVYSGVATTPDDLIPLVYVPGRKGSFQPELKAAARRAGRLPYELDGSFSAVGAEVGAGNPVLVLQNLGLGWLPKWHYAVVIGYDAARDTVILRSGTEKRREEKRERFLRSWQLADNWAMVVVRPGQLPATTRSANYVRMLAESEEIISTDALTRALDAGLRGLPASTDLQFAAANHARLNNKPAEAGARYRVTLALDPRHAGALNNYADLLLAENCMESALEQITAAHRFVSPNSPFYPTVEATAREIRTAVKAGKLSDSGPACEAILRSSVAE